MLSDREKMEEELKLLEESFSLDVVTKEEYEQAKHRIESQLKALEQKEKKQEVKPAEKEEYKSAEEIAEEEVKKALAHSEEKKEELAKVPEPEEEKIPGYAEENKGSIKLYIYAAIFLLVLGGAYFFYGFSNTGANNNTGANPNIENQNGKVANIEDTRVKVTILNGASCFNCETERVLGIVREFFPNTETDSVDFESGEGKDIAKKYGIEALPAYIFDSNVKSAHNYGQLSATFKEVDGSFVMKNNAANSNYYISREEIPNKLDLIFIGGQQSSQKAEENLKQFLDAFKGIVKFEKHEQNSNLAKELGVNTFPVFLVNNKIKFNGVQSSQKIKENFCAMNKAAECILELSNSLV